MKERTFNSLMPRFNEQWVASLLKMKKNPGNGPDLIDNEKAVEVKFKIIYPKGEYTHKCWKVLGNQLNYDKDYPQIYWGFGLYRVKEYVKKVKQSELEDLTEYRELYLVNWNWVKQFPVYHHKGKTKFSEWEHDIIFPKFSLIPKVIEQKEVEGGKIFFTEGVNPFRFEINTNPSQQKHYKDVPF